VSQLRVVKEGEGSGYPKASLLLRAAARLIDSVICWAMYVSVGPAGVMLSLLYILFADGLLAGQSPGKKICGIKVVYVPTRSGARHRDSVLRNAPFGLIIILSMLPEFGHRAFFAGLGVIGGIEALLCLREREGLRLGDLWAQTQVIDGKVQADQPQRLPTHQEAARAPARLRQQSSLRR
jgi:uncharacterized RDD family membrane protein YckC